MIAVAPDAKIWLNRTSASIGFGSREVLRSQERDGAFPEDELRAEKYDGVFMIDSTCMFPRPDDWEFDMAEILEYVWKETEVRMLAVVWVDTSEWAYEEMLSMIRESFDANFIVWVEASKYSGQTVQVLKDGFEYLATWGLAQWVFPPLRSRM